MKLGYEVNILGFHAKEEEVKETKKLNNLGI